MNPSLEYLLRCSAETGFAATTLEKVVRLGALAADVGRHAFLREALALKGGTALNLGFGPPTRLSVDLDFNYIGSPERAVMLEERPRVEQVVIDLARRSGYRVQRSADAFAGRKIYLHYASVSGPEDRIEVDLNFLFRVPLDAPLRRELWQPGELDRPELLLVGNDELLVGKLMALLDRCAARDAWDTAHLAPELVARLAEPILRARFVAIAGTLSHPLWSYGRERLEQQLTQKKVDERLLPMLAAGQKVEAAELVAAAWQHLERLVDLRPEETRYMEDLERGQLNLEGLFGGDAQEPQRLARHPALLWKVYNVRKHRKGAC